MPNFDVLIVGGGHGGAQAAVALRQQHYTGSIAIVGEEPELPYDRPPLSKEYLTGSKPWERLLFRTKTAWAEKAVDVLTERRVSRVEPDAHRVHTLAGETFGYGKLIWATGGTPRRLTCSGADAIGIHTIRNRADVDRLSRELPDVTNAVVIGGGYIGLEAAAALSHFGKRTVLLEALPRVLERVAGEPLSRFYEDEHRRHGISVRVNARVDCIVVQDGKVAGVRLDDGEMLPADVVIVGIGIEPSVAPLIAAGADGSGGVRVDEYCRTTLPDVYAIGDCAEHPNVWAEGDWVRLESVQNANDQAAIVAKDITGSPEPYRAIPWFWSNQYDLKLQTIGLSRNHDDFVIRGDPASRSFSVVYLRRGQVIALDCVNAIRDYVQGRLLIAKAAEVERSHLADPSIPLKTLV